MAYIGAPYNFVPFSDKVLSYPEKLPGHDSAEDYLSGEISYKVTAESDIFVGSGVKNGTDTFFRDAYGRFALPGSTMRGLVRGNVQILSLSEMGQDIDGDYSLMYRNIANGAEKKRYGDILGTAVIKIGGSQFSVLKDVEAGYIERVGGKYRIRRPFSVGFGSSYGRMNYYILSERFVAEEHAKGSDDFSFFFQDKEAFTQHDLRRPFHMEESRGRKHYRGTENVFYKPYAKKCYYKAGGKSILSVKAEMSPGYLEGYAVSTGKMQEKKAIYIIPAVDKTQPYLEISPERVKSFKVDFEKRKTTLKTLPFGKKVPKEERDVEIFNLPKEGEQKPVFFITARGGKDGQEEVINFGFTPRLRLLYDHTIAEGIPEHHKKGNLDYANALFGFSKGKSAYKSRLSFSDAVLEGDPLAGEDFSYIPGEPKPTSYLDYLEQEGNRAVTYNKDGFHLRGIKQYWLRDQEKQELSQEKTGESYANHFRPLGRGSVFIGKIRFHNLKKEELGLLLWALTLKKGAQMNLGKAKAYGFGIIQLDILHARLLDDNLAYSPNQALPALSVWKSEEINIPEMVEAYKKSLQGFLGKRPEGCQPIKTFLQMKDPSIKPANDKTRYMRIDQKEYQSRDIPLQKPEELLQIAEKQAPKTGEYEAEVVAVENRRTVKFRLLEDSSVYGKVKREDILGGSVEKNQMESLFKAGNRITVLRDENGKWKCVAVTG